MSPTRENEKKQLPSIFRYSHATDTRVVRKYSPRLGLPGGTSFVSLELLSPLFKTAHALWKGDLLQYCNTPLNLDWSDSTCHVSSFVNATTTTLRVVGL